jgi:hypothetical protein
LEPSIEMFCKFSFIGASLSFHRLVMIAADLGARTSTEL